MRKVHKIDKVLDKWRNYIRLVYLNQLEKECIQYKELKMSFYSGALTIIDLIENISKIDETEKAIEELENIKREVFSFFIDIKEITDHL